MTYILKDNEVYILTKNIDSDEYIKRFGGTIIDETHELIVTQNKLAVIDTKIAQLKSDYIDNELDPDDLDYQSNKDAILIEMKNLRDDRRALTNE